MLGKLGLVPNVGMSRQHVKKMALAPLDVGYSGSFGVIIYVRFCRNLKPRLIYASMAHRNNVGRDGLIFA
jgi:hypothetical protein